MSTPIEGRRAGSGWPGKYGKWIEHPSEEQAAILEQLAQLSDERADLTRRKAYTTTAGRLRLDEVYAQLRKLIYDGHELGIGHEQMRDWTGVTSTAYYKIKSGRTGNS